MRHLDKTNRIHRQDTLRMKSEQSKRHKVEHNIGITKNTVKSPIWPSKLPEQLEITESRAKKIFCVRNQFWINTDWVPTEPKPDPTVAKCVSYARGKLSILATKTTKKNKLWVEGVRSYDRCQASCFDYLEISPTAWTLLRICSMKVECNVSLQWEM